MRVLTEAEPKKVDLLDQKENDKCYQISNDIKTDKINTSKRYYFNENNSQKNK